MTTDFQLDFALNRQNKSAFLFMLKAMWGRKKKKPCGLPGGGEHHSSWNHIGNHLLIACWRWLIPLLPEWGSPHTPVPHLKSSSVAAQRC